MEYKGRVKIKWLTFHLQKKDGNRLIMDIKRNGALQGIGKPELLKHDKSGLYSRQINESNRLIYGIDELQNIRIISCKGHYED